MTPNRWNAVAFETLFLSKSFKLIISVRNKKMPGDKVYIFDTTLRDGEQSAGVMMNPQEKLEIARNLERLGIDIIEA